MPIEKVPIIEAEHLTFIRGSETIIEDFSFSIKTGQFVAIIGPNGGGKTTLVHLLLGLIASSAGMLRVFGQKPTDALARSRIGYVPQRGGNIELFFPATATEVVYSGLTRHRKVRMQGSTKQKAVQEAFASLGIEDLQDRLIGSLSGGQRQRVLLARALVTHPDMLILDEPFDGLDPTAREEFHELLHALKKKGKTILVVTHDVHRVSREADAAICLRHALVCHGKHTCMVAGNSLRNLFHADHEELMTHHGD